VPALIVTLRHATEAHAVIWCRFIASMPAHPDGGLFTPTSPNAESARCAAPSFTATKELLGLRLLPPPFAMGPSLACTLKSSEPRWGRRDGGAQGCARLSTRRPGHGPDRITGEVDETRSNHDAPTVSRGDSYPRRSVPSCSNISVNEDQTRNGNQPKSVWARAYAVQRLLSAAGNRRGRSGVGTIALPCGRPTISPPVASASDGDKGRDRSSPRAVE
jgi:hypothetical protein